MTSWIVATIIVGVPLVVTLIGAATSPPMSTVPVGHILYLDADQPSEKTTMLHGLYAVGPDGREHLITHEQEPQDVDAGAREWIIEPAASPDGRQVAFVKREIVIEEEKQSVDNQIWVDDIDAPKPGPGRMIYDLTANKLDMVTRLAWTPDGTSVAFADGGLVYSVNTTTGRLTRQRVDEQLTVPPIKNGISSTEIVGFSPAGTPQVTTATAASTTAVAPRETAIVGEHSAIRVNAKSFQTKYGWSIFGGRQITSLRFSPDGRYVGYTVSKPPIAENEMFYLDTQTGKCYKLPFRCGPSAWDWGK